MATNNSNNTKTVTVVNYNDPVPGSTPLLQVLNSPGGNKYEIQINNGAGGFAATNSFVYSPVTGNVGLRGNLAVTGKITGKMTTSTQNLQIVGGSSGYVLSTDGTGNLSWADPMAGQYGNSNVANYLPTYNGDIGLDNVTITGNTIAVNINATSVTSNTLTSSENSYLYNVSATGLASLTTVTVGGNFTMGNGTANLGSVNHVKITGGSSAHFLQTDGTGNLTWALPEANVGTLQQVTTSGATTNVAVQFTNPTDSTNQTTGAVLVTGGVGVEGNVHAEHIHAHSSIYTQQTVYSGQNAIGSSFTKPLFIGKDTGDEYVQAAMVNSNAHGSADWVAYGDSGGDAQGWIDFGYSGTEFDDPTYTITDPSDGYIFSQGMPAQGGNLVIATGELGHPIRRDIVFATGGFLKENELARFDHANSLFYMSKEGSGIKFADGTIQYTAGGGSGGNVFATQYEVAEFVANTAPGFGEIQFANFEGSNSAPATAQKLFINAGSLNEQQLGTVLQQWTTNSYRGTLNLNNGVDQATFNISNGGLYFEPEVYRGFSAGLNQIWGDDCSINQLIITNATAPKFYNTEFLLEDDVFHATNLATGNTHVMLNVYGSSEYQPIDPQYLWSLFTSFVDGVLYDGETLRTDPGDMKTQFYNNTGSFRNQIPTQDYYQYFTFSNSDYFGTAPTTSGVGGTDATLRIRVNPDGTYIVLGIATAGIGYTSGDNLFVAGTSLGGVSPDNDLTLLIDSVDGDGGVTAVSYLSGTGVYPWPSNYISDGSDDQYDDGNYINTNLAAEISYGNGTTQVASAAFGGGDYCVMYNQSIFCMVATGSNINDLFYSGNLGSDGDGLLRWTGLRSNQNVTADNYAQYAYFDSEYLDGTLTIANGVTYDMTLDSAGINLDEYYAYYNNNNNDYYFGSKNTWRLESQNNLYVQSYNDMFIQTAINQRGTSESGPNININASAGSSGQQEINAQAGNGGSVNVNGGDAGGSDNIDSLGNNGGSVNINGGMGSGTGTGGSVYINGGQTESPVGIAGNVDIGTFAGPNGNGRVSISTNNGTTHTWVFDDTGNVVFPDGSIQSTAYTGGGGGSTGNVTFNDQAVVGTGDQYGGSGLYLAPGTESVGNLQYLRVRGGDYPTHIHLDTGNYEYYDQYFGNDNKYLKLSAGANGNILIGTDDTTGNLHRWTFDSAGNTTVPGNIKTVTTGFVFTSTITGVDTTTTPGNVYITLTDNVFLDVVTGQVTITGIAGTTEANGTWYFQAAEVNVFQIYYDQALAYPVDGTGWSAYISGGLAVSAGYNDLNITGGNVSIINNNNDTLTFDNSGNLIIPGVLSVANTDTVSGTNEAGVPGVMGSQTFNAQITYSPGIDTVQVGWTVTGNNLVGTTTVTSVVENSPGFYEITTDTAVTEPFWYNDVYTFSGVGTISWTFDSDGALNLPNHGVIRHDGDVNIVGTNFVQLQWVDSGNINIPDPNSSGGPVNWLYVDANGAHIETNIDTANSAISSSWWFDNTGQLHLPSGATLGYAGMGWTGLIGANTGTPVEVTSYTNAGNTSSQLFLNNNGSLILFTSDEANSNSYSWNYNNNGTLSMPGIGLGVSLAEQSVIQSQRKIIPALHYSAAIDGATPTVVYTATSSGISSLKMTISMTHSALGQEMFDISAMAAGANVMYSVSNRLNGTGQPDTSVSVDYDGSNRLAITLTVNSGATTSWVTYDSTEFGFQVD